MGIHIGANARAIDRMMPTESAAIRSTTASCHKRCRMTAIRSTRWCWVPPLPDGRLVRGVIVGVMFMEDEKGLDSKVVLSRPTPNGHALHALTSQVQREIGDYFKRYKQHQPGAFSKVPGWGTAAEGLRTSRRPTRSSALCLQHRRYVVHHHTVTIAR